MKFHHITFCKAKYITNMKLNSLSEFVKKSSLIKILTLMKILYV